MKLTKDEARILAECLRQQKFELNILSHNCFENLEKLEKKLEDYGKDHRRKGRTSMNDFNDCLIRFSKSERYDVTK